jgi:hypothetical protein
MSLTATSVFDWLYPLLVKPSILARQGIEIPFRIAAHAFHFRFCGQPPPSSTAKLATGRLRGSFTGSVLGNALVVIKEANSPMVGDSEVGTTRRYSSKSHGIAVHNSLAA